MLLNLIKRQLFADVIWLLLPLAMPAFSPVRAIQKITHSELFGWFTSGFE